jgi:S-adenosylmethionine:tRNA ribosyltransferase-isomerase
MCRMESEAREKISIRIQAYRYSCSLVTLEAGNDLWLVRTSDFDFGLPPELIAQVPAPQRDQSWLMVLHRTSGRIEHRCFPDLLEYLRKGDVLVLNDSRVIPARLRGVKLNSGGEVEMLLLEENAVNDWWVMLRPGKRARVGTEIVLRKLSGEPGSVRTTIVEKDKEGHCRVHFLNTPNIADVLDVIGEIPLPPYIARKDASGLEMDRERYQTIFADAAGSVAAPTAGVHFTESLLDRIRLLGVQVCFLTLHVGLGTFAPVKAESIAGHVMHEERYDLPEGTAELINEAKREKRRVIAVGTTTLRVLETVARHGPRPSPVLVAGSGRTQIFIRPPYDFRVVGGLLTNFHLPRSTLLMLVSAFAAPGRVSGRELILSAYAEAINQRYRFFSYGDAMLIL